MTDEHYIDRSTLKERQQTLARLKDELAQTQLETVDQEVSRIYGKPGSENRQRNEYRIKYKDLADRRATRIANLTRVIEAIEQEIITLTNSISAQMQLEAPTHAR